MHVVEPGETLGGIAARAQVPRVLIAEANRLEAPYTTRVGQKLLIPRTRAHMVEKGNTGFGLSYRYAAVGCHRRCQWHRARRAAAARQRTADPNRAQSACLGGGSTRNYRLAFRLAAQRFGPARLSVPRQSNYHDGLDIVAAKGSAVHAAAAGTVIFAGEEKNQFGNLVVIDHGNRWHSACGSLGRLTVTKGHQVTQGERVGLVGDTSVTMRTELHFELRRDGKPVDPLTELPGVE